MQMSNSIKEKGVMNLVMSNQGKESNSLRREKEGEKKANQVKTSRIGGVMYDTSSRLHIYVPSHI